MDWLRKWDTLPQEVWLPINWEVWIFGRIIMPT